MKQYTTQNRYYIQRFTDTCFLVREQQVGQEPDAADRILRTFTHREDAHTYAEVVNEVQRQLDRLHGYWHVRAV